MKKVLIFGINGYLGGLAALSLSLKDWVIHGIGTTKKIDPNINHIVQHYSQIKSRITELDLNLQRYDKILYCISLDHNVSNTDFRHTMDINCGILAELIQLSMQSAAKKIIYLSTMQVYKDQKFETDNIDPNNIYGYTHLACEQLLKLYGNSTVLRLSNVYGPPQTARANIDWTLIASLCKSIAKSGSMEIKNDGSAIRNFLFSEDFQDLIVDVLSKNEDGYEILNVIGNTTSTVGSIKRILQSITEEKGKSLSVKLPENYILSTETYLKFINSEANKIGSLKCLIGKTELLQGLKTTIKYYEDI